MGNGKIILGSLKIGHSSDSAVLCASQIREEASLPCQKVASHGEEQGALVQVVAGWVTSCWVCSEQTGAGTELKLKHQRSQPCSKMPLSATGEGNTQILCSVLKGWCLTAEKAPCSLNELNYCWGGATGSDPCSVSLSHRRALLILSVRMHSGPIFFQSVVFSLKNWGFCHTECNHGWKSNFPSVFFFQIVSAEEGMGVKLLMPLVQALSLGW